MTVTTVGDTLMYQGRSGESREAAGVAIIRNTAAVDATGAPKAPIYTATGYRQVTATGTAFALPTPPVGTRRAIIQAEAQAIRWRDDGTDPTTTVGMTIAAGGELRYDGSSMAALKLIAVTAGAIANISYYA